MERLKRLRLPGTKSDFSDLSTRTRCVARLLFILDRVNFEVRAVYVTE